jgi:ankyrin repeat protein
VITATEKWLIDIRLLLFNIFKMFIGAEQKLRAIVKENESIPVYHPVYSASYAPLEELVKLIAQMQAIVFSAANENLQSTQNLPGSILIYSLATQGLWNSEPHYAIFNKRRRVPQYGGDCEVCNSSKFISKAKLVEHLRRNKDIAGELLMRENMRKKNGGSNECLTCGSDLTHMWYPIAQLYDDVIKQGKAILGDLISLPKLPLSFQEHPIFIRDCHVELRTFTGGDPHFIDCLGRTRLHRSMDLGSDFYYVYGFQIHDYLSAVYQKGDPLLDIQDMLGRTVLHQACQYGYNDIAMALLELGADCKKKTVWGMLPLHHAAIEGYGRVCQLLLEAWPETAQERDSKGKTPLHYAASENERTTLEILIKNNIGLNIVDSNGDTPLMLAVKNGHEEEIVELFLKSMNVNLEIENKHGLSALDLAEDWNSDDVSSLIEQEIDRRHRLNHSRGRGMVD